MSITAIGALTLAAMFALVMFAPRKLFWLLPATAPFMRTAAITIGGDAFPPYYLVAALTTGLAVVAWINGVRVPVKTIRLMGWFVAWALLISAISPGLFAGVLVLDPRGGIDEQVVAPTPLGYTTSVLAQSVYLLLGAGSALYLAQQKALPASILTPGFALGTALSALRLLPGGPELLDPMFRSYGDAVFNVYETRHFGIFFEPSYLATFSVAAATYFLYRLTQVHTVRRLFTLGLLTLAILNLALSETGTAAATVVILAALATVVYANRFLFHRAKLHPATLFVPIVLTCVLIVPNSIRSAIEATIQQKLLTSSFSNRAQSNVFSMEVLWETLGIGSGLGTNRPSSFALLVISTTGIVGAILMSSLLYQVLRGAAARPQWRPVAYALLTLIVAKIVAEPDLSVPLLWTGIGVALCAMREPVAPQYTSGPQASYSGVHRVAPTGSA